MYQNYVAPTVLSVKYRIFSADELPLDISGTNDRILASGSTTNRGWLTQVDGITSDFIMNISFTSNLPTAACCFAVSWHGAGSPQGEPIDQFDLVPIPYAMVGSCNLSVHVPRPQLAENEKQYVGFLVTDVTDPVTIAGVVRCHTQDLQFLQPSK